MITVNSVLTKSRNPVEHNFDLRNQEGEIRHMLPDGYCLIRFHQFKIRKKISQFKRTIWVFEGLDWYIHKDDLK